MAAHAQLRGLLFHVNDSWIELRIVSAERGDEPCAPCVGFSGISPPNQLIDEYDAARDRARSYEVETVHGTVAQAALRDWLSTFLPKRYGVCSGYIVSQAAGDDEKLPEYDVIVYDCLNAPVLWVDDHADTSRGSIARHSSRARAGGDRGQGGRDAQRNVRCRRHVLEHARIALHENASLGHAQAPSRSACWAGADRALEPLSSTIAGPVRASRERSVRRDPLTSVCE